MGSWGVLVDELRGGRTGLWWVQFCDRCFLKMMEVWIRIWGEGYGMKEVMDIKGVGVIRVVGGLGQIRFQSFRGIDFVDSILEFWFLEFRGRIFVFLSFLFVVFVTIVLGGECSYGVRGGSDFEGSVFRWLVICGFSCDGKE